MKIEMGEKGFTLRAIILGAILCFIIGAGSIYNILVIKGSNMEIDFTTGAAIFLFFFLMLGNLLIKKLKRNFAFNSSELILVYIMMIIACSIPTMGVTPYLLGTISGVDYYATPQNKWHEIIFPHIKEWLIPRNSEAIRAYYEGGACIPWGVWLRPLLFWLPFILVFYLVMISMMSILRKQWIEKERLIFPLTILPLEMVKEDSQFLKNKLLWLGFAIPFITGSLRGLHHYFHFVPDVQLLAPIYIHILRRNAHIVFMLSFCMIGFTYFVRSDIALSLWFFNLLATLQHGWFNILGVTSTHGEFPYSHKPLLNWQCMGSLIVLVIMGLWLAREHLKEVFLKAVLRKKDIQESGEVISYTGSFWTMIGGVLFMAFWLWCAGLSFWIALLFLCFAFAIFIGITRVVSEGGLAETRAPIIAPVATTCILGSSFLGAHNLVPLGFTFVFTSDVRTFVMASWAQGLKLIEGRKRKNWLFLTALLVAILVTLFTSIWATITLAYKYGGINAGGWFFQGLPTYHWNYIAEEINHPRGTTWQFLRFGAIGAAVTGFLYWMRLRFLWWSFHPLGFAFSSIFLTDFIWFNIFIAWLLKSLILKYGGPRAYNRGKFFFMGLILGQFVCGGVWIIIDFFTHTTGNGIFWL